MKPKTSLHSPKGLTLTEILIVLAIVGGLLTAGLSMMGLMTQGQLKKEAMRMTSTIQYAYNQAALNNRPYRLVIDLDNQEYYTEISDRRVVVSTTEEDFEAGYLPEEARLMQESRRQRRNEFFREEEDDPFGMSQRVGFQRAEDAVISPRSLGNGIQFESVLTDNFTNPVREGKAAIHFFPNGFQQQARVVLVDPDSGAKFTLITEPLTGRVKVYSGEEEIPESFGRVQRHVR